MSAVSQNRTLSGYLPFRDPLLVGGDGGLGGGLGLPPWLIAFPMLRVGGGAGFFDIAAHDELLREIHGRR